MRLRQIERLHRLGIPVQAAVDPLIPEVTDTPDNLRSLLEALACGLPVITTVHNGAGELMHPPAEGYVVDDPHNASELASRLTDLLNPTRRIACGKAARQAAARWTFEHHVRAFEAVLGEASSQRRRAAG